MRTHSSYDTPIKFAIVDPSTAPDCTTKLTIEARGGICAGARYKHASELENDKKNQWSAVAIVIGLPS